MDFTLSDEHRAIQEAVGRIGARFDETYWLTRDREGGFPYEFAEAMAKDGWLGIAMPQAYGGAGLGITEAALMMQTVAGGPGAFGAASSIHLNIFGLNPVAVFGTPDQCSRMMPPIINGTNRACFGVTEPDAGLDTGSIKTKAVREGDTYIVHGRKVWTSTAQEADHILLLARTTPRDAGARVHELGMSGARDMPRALWRLRRIVGAVQPDIVQSWLYHADLLATLAAGAAPHARLVWTIRCSDMALARYGRGTAIVLGLLARLSHRPDLVLANSRAGLDWHLKRGYRPRAEDLIPNGFDLARFRPDPPAGAAARRALGIPQDALVVGTVARVDPMKDYDTFLAAMALLA